MQAFDVAAKRLSVAQMKRIAKRYGKKFDHCGAREDYINLLVETLSSDQKVKELRQTILARRGSLVHYRMIQPIDDFRPEVNFVKATDRPTIVSVGRAGEIHDGQLLIQWAVRIGMLYYIDVDLELATVGEAAVIDSFYEPAAKVLQIRAPAQLAKRIGVEWAKLSGLDVAKGMAAFGLSDQEQVHEFADVIGGTFERCGGEKVEGRGFLRVTGHKHPALHDLRGTADFLEFLSQTIPKDFDIAFIHDGCRYKMGIGLETRSIFFKTNVSEDAIQFVYDHLKKFHDI
jgi:hypothetical protein